MQAQAFLRYFVAQLHTSFAEILDGFDGSNDDQSYRLPGRDSNHLAFSAWHFLRTEDNVVQSLVQQQPTIWLTQGLDAAWKLPPTAQGTRMTAAEAQAVRVPSMAALLEYGRDVWAATDRFLDAATDADLDRVIHSPFGEWPVQQVLGRMLIAHGNQHLGEIWLTRELLKTA